VLFVTLFLTAAGVQVAVGVAVIVVVVVTSQQKQTKGSVCTTQGHLQWTHSPEKVTLDYVLCIKATLLTTHLCNKWSNLVYFEERPIDLNIKF
jgi:ABC-type lipoprotein release transport system permease subunit